MWSGFYEWKSYQWLQKTVIDPISVSNYVIIWLRCAVRAKQTNKKTAVRKFEENHLEFYVQILLLNLSIFKIVAVLCQWIKISTQWPQTKPASIQMIKGDTVVFNHIVCDKKLPNWIARNLGIGFCINSGFRRNVTQVNHSVLYGNIFIPKENWTFEQFIYFLYGLHIILFSQRQ